MQLSAVAPVILGFLASRPRSGYEIKAAVDRSTRFFWAASYGQIYPELRRLETAGLIAGEASPTGGRRRRLYTLTEAGHEALRRWLDEPGLGHELRDAGLLKLLFSDSLGADELLELVARIRSDREDVLERLREIERDPARPKRRGGDMVVSFGVGNYEWQVAWCRRLEERLAAEKPTRRKQRSAS